MAAEDLAVSQATSIIPELTLPQIILIAIIGLIVLGAIVLLVYLIWDKIKQMMRQDYYKDAYHNFIAVSKNNCPNGIKGYKFSTASDVSHEGVIKGYICGYNLIKFGNKVYDAIVYNPNPFSLFRPGSWFSPDRIALMNSEKEKDQEGKEKRDKLNKAIYKWHSPMQGNITWYTIGTDRIGFFEYASNDTDLTPEITETELQKEVEKTAFSGLLKEMGQIVGDALHSNPDIRGGQKARDEIIVSKR